MYCLFMHTYILVLRSLGTDTGIVIIRVTWSVTPTLSWDMVEFLVITFCGFSVTCE